MKIQICEHNSEHQRIILEEISMYIRKPLAQMELYMATYVDLFFRKFSFSFLDVEVYLNQVLFLFHFPHEHTVLYWYPEAESPGSK